MLLYNYPCRTCFLIARKSGWSVYFICFHLCDVLNNILEQNQHVWGLYSWPNHKDIRNKSSFIIWSFLLHSSVGAWCIYKNWKWKMWFWAKACTFDHSLPPAPFTSTAYAYLNVEFGRPPCTSSLRIPCSHKMNNKMYVQDFHTERPYSRSTNNAYNRSCDSFDYLRYPFQSYWYQPNYSIQPMSVNLIVTFTGIDLSFSSILKKCRAWPTCLIK